MWWITSAISVACSRRGDRGQDGKLDQDRHVAPVADRCPTSPPGAEANGDERLDAGQDNGVYVFYVRKTDQG
jgi:hypothetical protein